MSEKYFPTARPTFKNHRVFDGQNFMTPNILSYTMSGDYEAELSSGKGIWSPKLYGVTVAKAGKKMNDLCTCFQDRKKAEEYIASLVDYYQSR